MKVTISNKTDEPVYIRLTDCKSEELCGEKVEVDATEEFKLETTVANLYVWLDGDRKCDTSATAEWSGAVPVGQYVQIHSVNGRLELWMDDQLLPEVTVEMCKKTPLNNFLWKSFLFLIISILGIVLCGCLWAV